MITAPSIRYTTDPSGSPLAYAVHGDGPLLVCPAWWVSHLQQDWEQAAFRVFFEQLGTVARVVRYDRPGVGMSTATGEDSAPNRGLQDDLATLEHLIGLFPDERVTLLGASSGGPPAVAWAATQPLRAECLLLFGSFARGVDIAPRKAQDALCHLVEAHWGVGSRALADVFLPDSSASDRQAFVRLQRSSTDAVHAAQLLRATYEMDVTEHLAKVKAKTHIFHRRGDVAIPLRAGRALALGIEDAEFHVLEGKAHPMWMGAEGALPLLDVLRDRTPRLTRGCHLDEANRQLVLDGRKVALTPLEFGLLRYLILHRGEVVTREVLLSRVWGQTHTGSNVVDAGVRQVRKKLSKWARSIETVPGHGYRFSDWKPDQI